MSLLDKVKEFAESEEDNPESTETGNCINGAEPLSGGPWNTGARSARICRESLLT